MRIAIMVVAAGVLLSGCATITKGTSQDIAINTDPQGARCEVQREGAVIAVADPTPETVNIDKSSKDIHFACSLEDHREARYVLTSETEAMTVGNVLFGGVIGLAVDAGTGAMNKYRPNVTVVMQREEQEIQPVALID